MNTNIELNKSIEITADIKGLIEPHLHERKGQLFISLPNCRLDFSTEYKFDGYTKRGVKLSQENGNQTLNYIGKVFRTKSGQLKLITEGWSFILRLSSAQEVMI
ncbi:MAG: hypothetical protein Q8O68_00670 [Candidatus Daviesbacteria bacterium]|nr:hypothetical protein [Candidatus Daviesbacteria bacterium]